MAFQQQQIKVLFLVLLGGGQLLLFDVAMVNATTTTTTKQRLNSFIDRRLRDDLDPFDTRQASTLLARITRILNDGLSLSTEQRLQQKLHDRMVGPSLDAEHEWLLRLFPNDPVGLIKLLSDKLR